MYNSLHCLSVSVCLYVSVCSCCMLCALSDSLQSQAPVPLTVFLSLSLSLYVCMCVSVCLCVCVQCRPMPTSNLRRRTVESRETVASCLCWDRRVPCHKLVCDGSVKKSASDDVQQCQRVCESVMTESHQCRAAQLPPVDCYQPQTPACPY